MKYPGKITTPISHRRHFPPAMATHPPQSPQKCNASPFANIQTIRETIQLALISADVYQDPKNGPKTTRPYQKLSDAEVLNLGLKPSEFNDPKTGFYSALYYHPRKKNYVLAFRGTHNLRGMIEDYRQYVGEESPQYMEGVALSRHVSRKVGKENLILTGHSLGGGLAAVAALATGRRATTFNAAYVHPNTLRKAGVTSTEKANQLISAYYTTGDGISRIEKIMGKVCNGIVRLADHLKIEKDVHASPFAKEHHSPSAPVPLGHVIPINAPPKDPRVLQKEPSLFPQHGMSFMSQTIFTSAIRALSSKPCRKMLFKHDHQK